MSSLNTNSSRPASDAVKPRIVREDVSHGITSIRGIMNSTHHLKLAKKAHRWAFYVFQDSSLVSLVIHYITVFHSNVRYGS